MEYCTFILVVAFTLPSQSGSNKCYFLWARNERGEGEKNENAVFFLFLFFLINLMFFCFFFMALSVRFSPSVNCTDSFG